MGLPRKTIARTVSASGLAQARSRGHGVDRTPANTRRWLAWVDEMTQETGWWTSESVAELWNPGEPR